METGIDLSLVAVFLTAVIGIQASKMLRIPSAIALILVGLFFGPAFLNIVQSSPITEFLASVGIILMLFKIGLESDITILRSNRALVVGASGLIIPWLLGYGLTFYLGYRGYEAFFVGVILTATSVGITMAILQELQMTYREFARIILGAAVVDDVLGLIALSLTTTLAQADRVGALEVLRVSLVSIGLIVFSVIFGIKLLSLVRRFSHTRLSDEAMYLLIISLAMLASVLAEDIGLSAIVGAFLAGLVITESKFCRECEKFHERLDPVVALFSPIFFLQMGLLVNREDLLAGVYLGLLLTIVAVIGKYLGCYYASRAMRVNKLDSMLIGFGMIPRGEVALIAAQIGLSFAIISPAVFSAVVVMSLLTSVLPPVIFLHLLKPYRTTTPEEYEAERRKIEESLSIINKLRKHLTRKKERMYR